MTLKTRRLYTAILFVATQVLPVAALVRLSGRITPLVLLVYLVVISMATCVLYWLDKRKAQRQKWRIPEAVLHISELVGGWASAYWAQRLFRHKNRKLSYQVVFWVIAILHQLLAYDYLDGWRRLGWIKDIVEAAFR